MRRDSGRHRRRGRSAAWRGVGNGDAASAQEGCPSDVEPRAAYDRSADGQGVGTRDAPSVQQECPNKAWPQAAHDPGRTGHAPDNTLPETPVGEVWQRRFESSGRLDMPGTATVAGETVFTGGNALVALSARDGTTEWRREIGFVRTAPAVTDGTVFAGTDNGFHAVDAASGTERWVWDYPDSAGWRTNAPPAVAGQAVYVPTNDLFRDFLGVPDERVVETTLADQPVTLSGGTFHGHVAAFGTLEEPALAVGVRATDEATLERVVDRWSLDAGSR